MKNRQILTYAILALSLVNLTGCKKEQVTGEPMALRVVGVSGMNDFPSTQKFGLFADSPVNADNVPFSITQGFMPVFENTPTWGYEQSTASRLLVYSPYNPDFDGTGETVVDIETDQSTPNGFLSANYLMGVTSGKPGASNTVVRMEHVMSGMMLKFDNRTGDGLVGCTVSGFMTQGVFDKVSGQISATGKNRMITPLRSPYGGDVFFFLYLPQEVNPIIYLTFESGREMTLPLSNSFHKYPGKIVAPSVITLTEDIQDVHMVSVSGVSLQEWNSNTYPSFPTMKPYYNLRTLGQVETDSVGDGHFIANVNKFYLTAVDDNNAGYQGVILEDSTRAIYAWMYPDHKADAGYSYVGQIEGLLNKTQDGDYSITRLFLTNATANREKELPGTVGNFPDLVNGLGNMEYRRMLFKDVTVVRSFESGMAVFSQNGVEMPVVLSESRYNPAVGSKGDIIGFPIMVAGKPAIRLFDDYQLRQMKKEYESDAFTRAERPGMYDLSQADTAIIDWDYPETSQMSVRRIENNRTLQISDFSESVYKYYLVYSSTNISVGQEYCVAIREWSLTYDYGITIAMECVRKEDGKAWFRSRTGNGLIIAL